jgi:hypothetical protein
MVTLAASFSSMTVPLMSETQTVLLAMELPFPFVQPECENLHRAGAQPSRPILVERDESQFGEADGESSPDRLIA